MSRELPTNSAPRRKAAFLGIVLVLLFALATPLLAMPNVAMEYRIKAAYLYNFTKFISWPPTSYANDTAPLVIGLVSTNTAAETIIQQTMDGKTTASGRRIDVRVFDDVAQAASQSQILFVLRDAAVDARQVQTVVKNRPVLVVGEKDGFAQHGGVINFVVAGDAVRFEINPRRAETASLHVSGSLVTVARLVRDRED